MRASKIKRNVALLGLLGAAASTALLVAAPAGAATSVGAQPGQLSFTPASGGPNDTPTWTSATVCPAPFNDGGIPAIFNTDGSLLTTVGITNPDVKTAPFSGVVDLPMSFYQSTFSLVPGTAYEWAIECQDPDFNPSFQQSMWVTWAADGSWTSSQTPPQSGAVSTTTSLSASKTNPDSGESITLTATVAATSGDPAGSVEFFDNGTSLGAPVAVSGGTATMPFSSTTSGAHSLTATFTPSDPNAFTGSTSSAVSVTVGGGGTGGTPAGAETIQVDIPQRDGEFTVTVDNTPVSLGTAADNGNGKLEATGQLSPVTVNDGRVVSKPGWSVSGQVGDFSNGTDTIDGNSLGWTPAITTPNTANDVTAGPAVAPGSDPGLKQGSALASAAVANGVGSSVLGGGLDLQVPTTTNAGAYSATLTITAIATAP